MDSSNFPSTAPDLTVPGDFMGIDHEKVVETSETSPNVNHKTMEVDDSEDERTSDMDHSEGQVAKKLKR